jgi:predicted DNA-binding transcriptional regulator AlpA
MLSEKVGKRLLSRDEIESEYGISRRWLELAAHRGDGPPMRKISRRMVRYDRTEFEAWLEAQRVESCDGAA